MSDELQGKDDLGVQEHLALFSVRDIAATEKLFPETPKTADLHGLVTRVTSRGSVVFFVLHDGTASIQLVADRGSIPSQEAWEQIESITVSARIRARGRVGHTDRGRLSVFLTEPPSQLLGPVESEPEALRSALTGLGSQVLLARLRDRATAFFKGLGFLEIEPKFIFASWETTGLEPLKVLYPGFGVPVYLVPSPARQLLSVITLTGNPKVFSVSRCFTTSHLGEAVGTESMILCAKELGASLTIISDLAVKAVKAMLDDPQTIPEQNAFLRTEWPVVEVDWPPEPASFHVDEPEVQIFRNFRSDDPQLQGRSLQLFRVCWPRNIIVAEGSSGVLSGSVVLGSLTINVERMVALIGAASIRQLLHP